MMPGGSETPRPPIPPEVLVACMQESQGFRYSGDRTGERLRNNELEPDVVKEVLHRWLEKKESGWYHEPLSRFPSYTQVGDTLDDMAEDAYYGSTKLTETAKEKGVTHEKLKKEYSRLYQEFETRKHVHEMMAAYWGWIADLPTEAQQVFLSEVSWIPEEEYDFLFNLGWKEGEEKFGFGEKINRGMWVLHANALGVTEKTIPEWTRSDPELREAMLNSGKLRNISAYKWSKKEISAVEAEIKKGTEGNEAAMLWAYRIYRFWGEASFNGADFLRNEDGIISPKPDGQADIYALEGAPASDDLIKLFHFTLKRWKDWITPHGPDITVTPTGELVVGTFGRDPKTQEGQEELGILQEIFAGFQGKRGVGGDERNYRLADSKLRFVFVYDLPKGTELPTGSDGKELKSEMGKFEQYKKTMYEMWWNKGKSLGEIQTDNIPNYQDREYWLRIFFAGRDKNSLYSFLTSGVPDEKPLQTIEHWRTFFKSLFVCTGGDAGNALVLSARYHSSMEEFNRESPPGVVNAFLRNFVSQHESDPDYKGNAFFLGIKQNFESGKATARDKLSAEVLEMQNTFEKMYLLGQIFLDVQAPGANWNSQILRHINIARRRAKREYVSTVEEVIPRPAIDVFTNPGGIALGGAASAVESVERTMNRLGSFLESKPRPRDRGNT